MLGQTIAEQFSWEVLLVSYFIILVITIEIALFFIIQKATRKERSPTWILTFTVTMFAFTGVYVMRALRDLVYSGTTAMDDTLLQVDLIVVSACGVAIGMLMRIFFRSGKKVVRLLSVAVVVAGLVSLALNIYSLFASWGYAYVFELLAGSLIVPLAIFPIYLVWQLIRRDESGNKKIFIVILLGVLLNFVGLGFNFQRTQDVLFDLLGSAYDGFKIAVLAIIIAGLAMIMFGFFYIPPVDDFFWVNQLVALYILDKATRTALFKKVYDQKVVDGFSFGGRQDTGEAASESAFVSGIGGITEMLSETAAADGKRVEQIDQGSVKLLLSYQGNLIFVLLARQAMPVLSYKLRMFKDNFLLFFGDMISRFASKPEKFLPADSIATQVFGTAGEKKR